MSWRLLLAAVAVSCTLRTHAHGPRDRIKDLMCVLLLSGMQKEDLDVSMLNKLQRYNVNIHDTNNELLQECMTLRNKSSRDMINTTVTSENDSEGISQDNEKSSQPMNPVPPNTEPKMQTVNIKQEIINDTIQYMNGKPKLDSVLKFWSDMSLKNETTGPPKHNNNNMNDKYVLDQKNKRNVQENSDSNEEDDIKKLLENYFSKKQHKNKHSKKEKTTTTRSIDDIYRELIQSRRENKNHNFDIASNLPKILPLNARGNDEGAVRLLPIEEPKRYYGNFSNILGAFNRFNTNEDNRYSKENKRLSDNPYIRKYMESERLVSTTERETEGKISKDMIKEIANSVKELVLRDLKLNIQATSTFRTSSISPTTTRTMTSTMEDNNLKIQQSVFNKFLEMFEEIKSLKKNTIVISSNNINKKKVQQVPPRALTLEYMNGMEPLRPAYNNPYQVKYPKTNLQTINFLPQEHKFRSNEVQVNVKTAPKSTIPIMFQTNNLEIPPLGIHIDTPLNPINQNIIVTTETPYRIGVIKNNLKPRNNPFADLNKFDERIAVPKQSHMSKSRDNSFNIPTSYDDRFTNKQTPKHHPNYFDKVHASNYRPRAENLEYMKPPEISRFHERLENIDFLDVPDKKRYSDRVDCCNEKYAFSKQMVECCNRKIASRQQMSLNNVKKGSYDDTHFKNFLKTQQKVTDMLERILATRDTVRSVETT